MELYANTLSKTIWPCRNLETTTNVVWFFKENTSKMAGNSYTPNQFGSWSMASTSRTYTSTTMSSTMATISTNTTESKNPKEKSTSEVSCQNLKITETSRNSNIYIPSEYAIGARSPSVNTGFLKSGFLKINYDFIFHFF